MKGLLLLFLCALSFVGCTKFSTSTFVIDEIDLPVPINSKIQIAKDLLSYNYGPIIQQQLKISDKEVLGNVKYDYLVNNDNQSVVFRLQLKDEALAKENELRDFFNRFVQKKINYYRRNYEKIDSAELSAYRYLDFLDRSAYDSLWQNGGPALKKYVTLSALRKGVLEWKSLIAGSGNRQMIARLFDEGRVGIEGELYTIAYEYQNKDRSSVTVERYKGTFRFTGFRNYPAQK